MRYEGIQSFYDFRQKTAEELNKEAKQLVEDAKAVYDKVGAVERENVSYATVIQPLLGSD